MTADTPGKIRLGWLSSGGGEGSYGLLKAVLDAIQADDLNASVEFVFCNRELGQAEGSDRFIAFAESHGIPVVTLSSQRFRSEHGRRPWAELREEFDRAVLQLIAPFEVDMTVNAGYMLIAPLLCREHLMINLHPALPDGPAGMWQRVIRELISNRSEESGAMVHIVTEEVDEGPVLSFCRFSTRGPELDALWEQAVKHDIEGLGREDAERHPLFVRLREMGLARERPLLVQTLKAIAGGRISLEDAPNEDPIDITAEVEANLGAVSQQAAL